MKEQQIDLLNISEREALVYLDQLTEGHLDKQSSAVALFSIKKLKSALDELDNFRTEEDQGRENEEYNKLIEEKIKQEVT